MHALRLASRYFPINLLKKIIFDILVKINKNKIERKKENLPQLEREELSLSRMEGKFVTNFTYASVNFHLLSALSILSSCV